MRESFLMQESRLPTSVVKPNGLRRESSYVRSRYVNNEVSRYEAALNVLKSGRDVLKIGLEERSQPTW